MVINTIVAEALDKISDELEKFPKKNFNEKLQVLLQKIIKAHKRVIFNGDGYTEAWKKEAAKRGLPNAATTPEALGAFVTEKSKALFTKYNVFTEAELESRYEIFMEEYAKKIRIEGELCLSMSPHDRPARCRKTGRRTRTGACQHEGRRTHRRRRRQEGSGNRHRQTP